MRKRSYRKTQIAWVALFAIAVLLVSSPAQAIWRNRAVPNVSLDWTLNGVYSVSKTEAWAVGSDFVNQRGVILHNLNGVWSSVTPPIVSLQWELFDVSFTSASEGWAVGRDSFNNRGVLLQYRNGTWTSITPPVVSSSWFLVSVQFTSASEGWAVGVDDSIQVSNEGVLLHFQSGSWTKASHDYVLPTWSLNDVYLTSAQSGWAVGSGFQVQQKGIMLQWQNNRWNNFLPPNAANIWELVGLNFTSPNDGWAVGNDFSFFVTTGIFLHFFNNSWTPVPFSLSDPNVSWFLSNVFFPVTAEGWAVGTQSPSTTEGSGLLIHFQNGSWSAVPPPAVSSLWGLSDLHFTSTSEGWAVGRDQTNKTGVILRFNVKPEITVTPLVANFKNIPTGTLAKRTVTVQNDGFSSLILGAISVPADPFSRVGGSCRDGQALLPGQACTVVIGFEPATVGAFESSFDLSSNDADESVVAVTVKGRSGAADLTGEWVSPVTQSCQSTTSGTICKLSGSLRVRNVGYKNILTASVQYFLSDDAIFDAGDRFLKKFATGELLFGKSKRFLFGYKLPVGETASGKYVIAVMDINNKIAELDETNNAIVSGPIPTP